MMALVKSVRRLTHTETLYDIGVEDNHNFFADGVLVHNCHRLSKSQQDVLLPAVEDGTITLFGATTEKPKFAVNSTVLSRTMVWELQPLSNADLITVIKRVRAHYKDKGKTVSLDQDAAKTLILRCSGDARKLITAMETIVEVLSDDGKVSMAHVDAAFPDKHLVFDASGNEHFDLAHAYQESIQHSEGHDAIYWLAKWLSSGEDPVYICRRMMITAFEDCGGNPLAPLLAMAAHYTAERTGMPECAIPMAYATVEMAKSSRNKTPYWAIKNAMDDVAHGSTVHVAEEIRAGTDGYNRQISKTYIKGWQRDAPGLRPEVADDVS